MKKSSLLVISTIVLVFGIMSFLGLNSSADNSPKETEIAKPDDSITRLEQPISLQGWPCDGNTISLEFGLLRNSKTGEEYFHDCIDILGKEGGSVYAARDGIVKTVDNDDDYCNYIVVVHEDGIETEYRFLNDIYVSAGSTVTTGDIIGAIGDTGSAAEVRLGFAVYDNGTAINPFKLWE